MGFTTGWVTLATPPPPPASKNPGVVRSHSRWVRKPYENNTLVLKTLRMYIYVRRQHLEDYNRNDIQNSNFIASLE